MNEKAGGEEVGQLLGSTWYKKRIRQFEKGHLGWGEALGEGLI